MPPKGRQPHKKPQNRVRPTQRSVEAKQFSTVRLPRSSEINVNTSAIHDHHAEHHGGGAGGVASVPSTSQGGFDPISNDGMFTVIANSKYWPPMPLEQLLEQAPPELLGKVRSDDDGPAAALSDSDDGEDVNSLSNDSDDDNAAPSSSTKKEAAASSGNSGGGIATKAERIQQILNSDGAMDLYDRRDDEAKARKMLAKARKVAGELSHPRGKAPVNTKQTFDDDSD